MSHTHQASPTKLDSTLNRVVVFGIPDDPHRLRDLLVEVLDFHPVDAQIQVHALPGVLPPQLPTHDAAQLAAAIRDLGVNATTIADKDVPSIQQTPLVHHLRCLDEGLEVVGLRGKRDQFIHWSDVTLISVGYVSESKPANVQAIRASELTLGPPRCSSDVCLVPHQTLEALVLSVNPTVTLRIKHDQMNYEYLAEQTAASGTVNFRRLVSDLIHRASGASLTPATRAFSEHGLLRHFEFDSFDEFERYTLFQLLVRQLHSNPPTAAG